MVKTFSKELIAPCGMNCNLCSGYLAEKHELKEKGVRIPYCKGCRPRDKQCAFLKKRCSRLQKKTIDFCFECPKFPCKNLIAIDTRYRRLFRMSLLENLREIKDAGMDTFLKTQQKYWRCPTCDGFLCCHNGLCFHCETETLKTKKNKYRWDDE